MRKIMFSDKYYEKRFDGSYVREIKFRGVTPTECWITGSLIYHGEQPRIEFVTRRHPADNRVLDTDWAYVDPTTVGQFTGLLDKNGKEIYEGDIVTTVNTYVSPAIEMSGIVTFRKGKFMLCTEKGLIIEDLIDACQFHRATINGNIHDNLVYDFTLKNKISNETD